MASAALRTIREAPAPAPSIRVKSLGEASPAYTAICAKYEQLGRDRVALIAQSAELAEQLRTRTPAVEADSRIAALLDGVPGIEAEAAASIPELRLRLADVNRQIGDNQRAMRVLEDRRRDERGRASVTIREEIRPEYSRLVRALCSALTAAHEANQSLYALIAELEANEVEWLALEPMQPVNVLGYAHDPESRVGSYLRSAVEAGFIDNADLPKPFRRGA